MNYRISNAMVLNADMKLKIVDPVPRRRPEFLEQFDYDRRITGGTCGAAQWIAYVGEENWDSEQIAELKKNEPLRVDIRKKVEANFPR